MQNRNIHHKLLQFINVLELCKVKDLGCCPVAFPSARLVSTDTRKSPRVRK